MDRFDSLRLFTRIVELGSFARAADDLDIPRATATHAIKTMEARLGARLLDRTTRSVRTTADGQAFYDRALRVIADLEEAEAALGVVATSPRGRLRVETHAGQAASLVIPRLPEFRARYPEIELEIFSSGGRYIDLVREGVDCAIRTGALADSSLIARRVAELEWVTCASRDYVARFGRPEALQDLSAHEAVKLVSPTSGKTQPLKFMVNGELREVALSGSVATNSGDVYRACCMAGQGLVQLPRYSVAPELRTGELVELLPTKPPPSLPVSVIYPYHRQLSTRLRVFVEWIAEIYAEIG